MYNAMGSEQQVPGSTHSQSLPGSTHSTHSIPPGSTHSILPDSMHSIPASTHSVPRSTKPQREEREINQNLQ